MKSNLKYYYIANQIIKIVYYVIIHYSCILNAQKTLIHNMKHPEFVLLY